MLDYIKRLSRVEDPKKLDWLIYFAIFGLLHIPAIINFNHSFGTFNGYLLFAQSLLKGSLALPDVSTIYPDMIFYHGQHYLPYPPFPSVILMPFVAIFGETHVNTVAIALAISCLNFFLLYKICIRLKVEQKYISFILVAFFFGSPYWYALFTSHQVYAFAHITSCSLQLLAISELLGKRRWWLVGVYIGCSFLSRQFTVFYILFALGYMLYLHQQKLAKIRVRDFFALGASVGFFVLVYLTYNYLRFGNALDTGYGYIKFMGVLKERVEEYGVFNVRYVPFNLYSFFLKGFNIDFIGKDLMQIKDMDLWGTSLLVGSPFVILSLKANWPKTLLWGAWATILIIITGSLFYHNNGYNQINCMRFSLDFLPLLIVLIAMGIKAIPEWLLKSMVVYSVC
jgi:4-amino-4-deoxy-L-arabinose transferase-like glycosyltransferase